MKSNLLSGFFFVASVAVACAALGMVVATVLSISAFLPKRGPAVNDTAAARAATTGQEIAPARISRQDSRDTAAGDPRSGAELDRAFERFLAEKGLPAGDPQPPPAAERSRSSAPAAADTPVEATEPRFEAATQRLKEDYPVMDARRQAEDEVWIRIDPSEAEQLSMDAMMARAAELYGDAGEPLKVVVWVGNQPQALQTFNGTPIF